MDFDRRRFIKGVGVAGIGGLAGCTGGPSGSDEDTTTTEESQDGGDGSGGSDGSDGGGDGSDGSDETTTTAEQAAEVEATQVGMVYATGGLGDGSFNDQAQQGLFAAEEEFKVKYQQSQPNAVSEFSTFQQQYAQSSSPDYDLVCCIGFLQTDALKSTSKNYPDQHFMLVDSVVGNDNVASYVFKEHEGSFLVGQMAGLLTSQSFSAGAGETKSGSSTLGFVGGVESDLIRKFEAGFKAGAKHTNEDIEVLTNYVGGFNEPSGGRAAATAMYNSGADIVYHASGNTGTGVFQAAQEKGRFAIGVDRDQSVTKSSYKNVILASMVKRVDTAVYNAIEAEVNGEFKGGSVVSLGLAQEGVGAVYGQQLGSEIPEEVKAAVSTSQQAIIDGELSVPTDPSNV